MASLKAVTRLAQRSVCSASTSRRLLHQTSARHAITHLEMPAMSPTMTEGGVSSWKKREGEAFTTGDVLLEIETDKATIDVEAQDDGIMGKILVQDGTKHVPIGKVIALLAEEGDDISNLEAPKEEAKVTKQEAPLPSPPPTEAAKPTPTETLPSPPQPHISTDISLSRPLFPSVHRLLQEFNVTKPEDIKGTGVRGMLTKGDVLAYLGKASSPSGTFKEPPTQPPTQPTTQPIEVAKAPEKEEYKPLDGPALRSLIASTMLRSSIAAKNAAVPAPKADFDSVIADYLPSAPAAPKVQPLPQASKPATDYLEGLH